jgi:3-oxoacyl-[acyl-carrier protein] reductase
VKTLAIELAPFGININALAPGNTETPINEDIRTKPELRHVYDMMKSRTPSNRVYSKPEDMAKAALYLASEDSIAMYGSTLVLDEGLIAGI